MLQDSEPRAARPPAYAVVPIANPPLHINEIFPAYENLLHPRFRDIRERYGLDRVVAGEDDDFQRVLLLRHWIKSHMRISRKHPTATRGDAFAILDAALIGGRFHCAHFMPVQHAVLSSFGYVTRCLGAGPGINVPAKWGHHGVVEVWLNSVCKWVLTDAMYDVHFEKDGVPLSALEVHDEVVRDGGRAVQRAYGPGRRRAGRGGSLDTYRWVSWHVGGCTFTDWPSVESSVLVVYEDDFFRENIWYRDGAPHWAYAAGYFVKVTRREWIEWTPNVVGVTTTIRGNVARFVLRSSTPNFKEYQMRSADGAWQPIEECVEQRLSAGRHEFVFRSVNVADVPGPEHRVAIERTAKLQA